MASKKTPNLNSRDRLVRVEVFEAVPDSGFGKTVPFATKELRVL